MNKDRRPIVPVYMFHSIADNPQKLPYGSLSTPVNTFMKIISYLHKHQFNTITLDNLYNYLSTGEQLPPKPIVLTFDDGYLDNWVNAFPILKHHGMKATMFVVPEFVDPGINIRPTLLDLWQKNAHVNDLSYAGFLSWNEMKEMQRSGLIDIQSHSLSHTYCFQRAEIIDFHYPGDRYSWLAWNKYPEHKYRWAYQNQDEFVEFGAPIYAYGRALAGPQYFPDESLTQTLQEYVKTHGGRHFFNNSDWRKQLFSVASDYTQFHTLNARHESQSEYEERVHKELLVSKELIEKNLKKEVNFLCWPGGAFNQTTQRKAQAVGYLATTKGSSKNTWGADPRRIDRIGGRVALTRNHPRLDKYVSPFVFAATVEGYRGNRICSSFLRFSFRTVHACHWLLNSRNRMSQ